MPDTTEELIAKSTGEDTAKYATKLEQEAEDIISELYKKEGDEDGSDDGRGEQGTDGKEGTADDDGTNAGGTGDAGDGTEQGDGSDSSKNEQGDGGESDGGGTGDDNANDDSSRDSVESLREQLTKSQKQAKDNKGEFTRRSQDLSEANKRSEHLEQNVFDLKNQLAELKAGTGKTVTSKTEESVTKQAVDIASQLEAIKEVDPDIAKAITPVFQDLVNQVASLQNEIKVNSEKSEKTASELIEDAHFRKIDGAHEGWEEMMKSEEFEGYINDLSVRQKRLALSDLSKGSAEDIIEIFTDYKSTLNTGDNKNDDTDDKKQKKVKQASKIANPKFDKSKETNRKAQVFDFTQREIAAMSPEEFAKKEPAIDIAMAKGKIDLLN
jgi:hypothetical protein